MASVRAFAQRHPVLAYVATVSALSWGALALFVAARGGVPQTPGEFEAQVFFLIPMVLGGPLVAVPVTVALVAGKAGFRELAARLRRWRVGARWYAVALLAAPLAFAAVHGALSLVSAAYAPAVVTADDKAAVVARGLVAGLVVGFVEELGWTGIATPALRRRHGLTATGVLLGFLWGLWHLPFQTVWPAVALAGDLPVAVGLPFGVLLMVAGQLAAYRVLMVRVHERTQSLPVAMLMHAGLTAASLILGPAAISGKASLLYGAVLAAAWWLVVAVLAVAARSRGITRAIPSPSAR